MSTGLIVLFVVLRTYLLTKLPVAFSIGISCMALLTVNGYPPLDTVVQRMANSAKSFNVITMPTLTFAGSLMVYGSTPRLMKPTNTVLQKVPGGSRAAAPTACGFFSAVSGSGVTGATTIGKIMGLEMLEQKYPRGLTVGLITAGGTMACITPLSIAMTVYTPSSGASVRDMFLVGFMPESICTIALIGFNTFFAVKGGNRESVEKTDYMAKEGLRITGDALLLLLVPILVLRGVFSGICTATETSVVAVIYSFVLVVFVCRELTLREFYKVAAESVVTIGAIMLTILVVTSFG